MWFVRFHLVSVRPYAYEASDDVIPAPLNDPSCAPSPCLWRPCLCHWDPVCSVSECVRMVSMVECSHKCPLAEMGSHSVV